MIIQNFFDVFRMAITNQYSIERLSLVIAIISLLFSLIALVWNIARNIFIDRIKLNLHMFAGEKIIDDQGIQRIISAKSVINIQGVEKTITAKTIVFHITNIGRRDIEIECIKATASFSKGMPLKEKKAKASPREAVGNITSSFSQNPTGDIKNKKQIIPAPPK